MSRFNFRQRLMQDFACLCGDFNDWDDADHPMERSADGGFALTLELETGRLYHFRYLLDEVRWENDWAADRYEPNTFGSEDSVVDLTDPPALRRVKTLPEVDLTTDQSAQ